MPVLHPPPPTAGPTRPEMPSEAGWTRFASKANALLPGGRHCGVAEHGGPFREKVCLDPSPTLRFPDTPSPDFLVLDEPILSWCPIEMNLPAALWPSQAFPGLSWYLGRQTGLNLTFQSCGMPRTLDTLPPSNPRAVQAWRLFLGLAQDSHSLRSRIQGGKGAPGFL